MSMKTNYPKIGIRPIIDGRRGGIRESLEDMTMGMARRVAELYTEKLKVQVLDLIQTFEQVKVGGAGDRITEISIHLKGISRHV